jgi:hypothetical protein
MAPAQDAIESGRESCVILTRSDWHPNCLPLCQSGNPLLLAEPGTADMGQSMAIRTREPSPLWVWLAIALLAVGGGAYAMAVLVFEHFTAVGG